jgi:RNA polymerase sigma-70 factor (ECF subfamily)
VTNQAGDQEQRDAGLDSLLAAARHALDDGEVTEARRLMDEAFARDPYAAFSGEWEELQDASAWPDAWLVAAVRRDPPDEQALNALADRYWKALYGRCQMLTLDHQKANDLAQDTWCRVLRSRHGLKPDGNFPAYLSTIAMNLWRDRHRSALRAGPMAENRMASLDAPVSLDGGDTITLADQLPDLQSVEAQAHRLLRIDIDYALKRLDPILREVVVSRFLIGESCAEIGQRHGRTEQTISAWVRQASREMKFHLEEAGHCTAGKDES